MEIKRKILITGSNGMLGQALTGQLQEKGEDFTGLSHSDLDITDKKKVLEVFSSLKPSLVIHAAAWTDVDGCEREPKKAFLINEGGTENISMACMKNGANLVYISTDFVFDGKKKEPYTEDDKPNPINVYGASKLAGEEKVRQSLKSYYIIRSSWLFGQGRHNFVTRVLSWAKTQSPLKIVEDHVGTPTYTRDLARGIVQFIQDSSPGLYHIANSGHASRYELAKAILAYSGHEEVEVIPVRHKDFSEVAHRPVFSALGTSRVNLNLPHWQEALKDYLREFSGGRA